MSTNYTRWYRTGTVTLTQGSKNVTGTNTYWASAGLNPGDIFSVDGVQDYEIDTITDNTHLTLKTAYLSGGVSGATYHIVRNFTATMQADTAARTAELVNDFRKYIDTDMQSIHGKSAYEVAVANGYTGTQSQWLESLKAAGEWTKLNERTAPLEYIRHDSLYANNKDLGVPTDAIWSEIRNKTYKGLYPGMGFSINGFYYAILSVGGSISPAGGGGYSDGHLIMLDYSVGQDTSYPNTFGWFTDSNTDRDPCYDLSKWFVEARPLYEARLKQHFGEAHLVPWRVACTVFDNSTKLPTATKNVDAILHLPSWGQMFGGNYHPFYKGGQCYDINSTTLRFGEAQLPGYRWMSGRQRDVIGYSGYGWMSCLKWSDDSYSYSVAANGEYYHGIFVLQG